MAKEKNFVEKLIERLKGDDAQSVATKIQKKGAAALKSQIAIKQAELLNKEEAVETAKENALNALFNNDKAITNNDDYCRRILETDLAVEQAEESLAELKKDIEVLEAALVKVNG